MTAQVLVGTLGDVATHDDGIDPKAKHADFARRFVTYLRRYGIKDAAVQEVCKVDDETVRLWRRGKRMPGDDRMKKLAKMIGVEPGELHYGDPKPSVMPQLRGEHVTDEDEIALLTAYRGIKKEWAREVLRRRAVELLEEFGEKGAVNPWGKSGRTTS